MLIIGCDYHPSVQQTAWVDRETGERGERRLMHHAEAEQFYRELKWKPVRVGNRGHRAHALVRAIIELHASTTVVPVQLIPVAAHLWDRRAQPGVPECRWPWWPRPE